LIPTFSIAGAAIANSIAYVSVLVIYVYLFYRYTNHNLFSSIRFKLSDFRNIKKDLFETQG
jgi:Na+-driven multidrug efflux pump